MPFESDDTTTVNITLASGAPVIVAGPNITVNTSSVGSVEITGSAGGGYWASNVANNIFTTGSIDVTGSVTARLGFSGSLTTLADGSPYILAGPGIIVNSSSNGAVSISSSVDIDPIYWTSTVANIIETTGSVVLSSGNLVATGSIIATTGFTGSLFGTASYASNSLTASYVLQAVSSSYASTASYVVSALTASYLVDTGFSGSLTRLKDGTPYLLAGPNITIITSSNGSIQISSSQADLDPAYWISNVAGNIFTTGSVDITGSLVASGSIQSITGFTGSLLGTASYATQAATASYVLQAVSASYAYTASLAGIATSSLNANTASYLIDTGFSGSLTRLKDGTPYLLAGTNITITTNSNGAIAISSSQADLDVNYWISNVAGNIFATGSVDITGSLYSSGSIGTLTGFTGSLLGTASYATQATTASYVLQAVSASFATNALTASYVLQAVSSSYASYAVTASQAGVATNALNANTASYVLQAVSASYASYAVTASQAGVATNALNANTASYVLQAVSASYASYAVTASQAGVATNALNANTASYVLQAVSASYASYAVTASQAGVATNALNANTASYVLQAVSSSFATSTLTASYLIDTGFSGSLTRLKDGTPYLLAGPNITITTSSNGSIEISGSQVDLDPIYWTSNIAGNIFTTGSVDITGSLVASGSIVALTGFTGSLLGTSSYSTQSATASYVLQAVSASYAYTASLAGIATSSLNANTASYLIDTGFSGSLTRLKDGTPYLLAGPNITITTSSNGSIQISGSQPDPDLIYWTSNIVDNIFTTGSVDITGSLVASGSIRSLTGFTGSLLGTASYATQANTASYVLQAVSASFATSALTASYVLQAVSSSYASYAVTASQAGVATNALNANTASYVLQAVSASYASYALTASQAGVATNALNANTASYVLQAVSASYASYALTASQAGVATNALNANTASYLVDTGFSGSITKLKDGTSYLLAGPNITITTNSNGAVAISASLAGATNYWQSNVAANIFTTGSVDITGSLVASGSIRALTGFTGSLLGTASYATQAATASYVLQAVSASYASTASYVVSALTASYLVDTGFSGSITRLKDGTPYLLAGPNITLNTASNGAISISGSGVYAPNIGWATAFEIDFATFPSQNLTGSAGTIFNGIQFEFSNSGNANWVGPSASLGFAINSKATSTELLDSVRTAPLVNIILTNLIGDYHPDDFDVRVWAQVTHNATNSAENYFLGFERVPAAAPYERMHIIRGYDTAQSTNMAVCYNNITANSTKITSSIELADNTQVVSLDKWTSATHYQTSGTLGTFPASSSLKLLQYTQMGLYSDTRYTTLPMTGSNVSVMFGAQTGNTSGTYSVVFRNLRVEYRKRGGGTYVTGSFVYNYGGGGYWTSPVLDLINTTGSVSLTNGNLTVTGSVGATLGFVGNLTGTASYASQAATASYVLQAVSASYASTASYLVDTGFSGSLTRLKDGTSYLLAGPNITITTNSNGAVAISGSAATSPSYWQSNIAGNIFTTGSVDITGSLIVSGSITSSNIVLNGPYSQLSAPNGDLIISSSNHIFITGSLIISGSRSSLGTEAASTLFDGDVFVSGGIGINDYIQLKPVNALRIPTNTTASYIYTSGSTNDMYFTQYQPGTGYTNTTRLRWLESTLSTGLLHGGIISSANGSTTFSVTSGSGIIVSYNASTTTEPYPTIQTIYWPAYVSQSLTYVTSSQTTYIGINGAGGIIQQTTPFAAIDYEQYIPIGRVLHQSGSITNGTLTQPHVSYGLPGSHDVFIRAFGPLKLSGHYLAASGSTLGITKTAGDSYTEGKNYTYNPSSPDLVRSVTDTEVTVSKIFRVYVSGSTPFVDSGIANAGYTTVDPGHYNNNGVLDTVSSGQYTIQRVFWFPNSVNRSYFVYYGNATYNSLDIAQSAIPSEVFVEAGNTIGAAILVGYILVKGNATNLSSAAQARIVQGPLCRMAGTGGGHAAGLTTPGGLDTYVQFNDGGSTFGGVAGLTFDKVTNTLTTTNLAVSNIETVGGNVTLGNATSDIVYISGSLTASNGLLVTTGSITSIQGFSGSLTKLTDGSNYLLAGPNIIITTSSNGSIQISGSQPDPDLIYWTSNIVDNIFTTGSVDITGSLVASGSIRALTGFTGSLLGTASYATQAATASYVLQAVSASYAYTASLAGIATSSLNANTASYLVDTGFSGSLTRLKDGTPYLLAGPNVTINTASNGSIEISGSQASYWTSNVAGNIFTTGSAVIYNGLTITGSLVQGSDNVASGIYSHAEGWFTTASAPYSHAEGYGSSVSISTATGSHVEGYLTIASAQMAHAEGRATTAEGHYSHAEGYNTITIGQSSHAEGYLTITYGSGSHVEGSGSIAYGNYSHAEGIETIASGSGQLTIGKYNKRANDYSLFVIGDGTGSLDNQRHDFVLVNSGSTPGAGTVIVSGSVVSTLGFTGSLFGTASYASTASYVVSALTASYLVDTGFSGSITKLKDGTPYLLAGPNITITTSSNGSIQISGSQPDPDLIYWVSNVASNIFTTGSVDITGSLVASGSIHSLTGFTGSLLGTASFATQASTASYVLQAVSSSYASYAVTASQADVATNALNANTASYLVDTGFSGSITKLKDGTSYLLAGPNVTITTNSNGAVAISASLAGATNYWQSSVAGNVFTTGSVDITGSLYSSGSIGSLTGFTGSLLGTASYASQAATASYVLQAVSSSYAYTASLAGIATSSLNANTASYLVDTGFSGSLTRLKDGTLYLIAGPNITITTNSNGSVAVSGSVAALSTNYWFSNTVGNIFSTGSADITGSLYSSGSITSRTGFTGSLLGTASYSTQAATASYVLQAVSASYAYTASLAGIATSSLNANTASYLVDTGFSGSLTRLKDGTLYLIAGPNVTITTNSNGSVAITGSAGSSSPQYWISPSNNFIYTTGSVEIYNGLSITGSLIQGTGNGASLVGQYAHAQGDNTVASGLYSHAEGTKDLLFGPVASGTGSHAEGYDQTEASGTGAHAEGSLTLASGFVAHSEGWSTVAAGIASHAEGQNTAASGSYAHAEGIGTIASGSGQLTVGRYNKRGNDFSLFVIGDGTADADASRGDIVRVNSGSAIGNGRVEITGSIVVTNGISGSLTKLKDGTSYLIAGTSITITTGSSGAVTIASTGGTVNTGSAILDFGLAPGTNIVSASVTGQASIVAGSQINAWIAASTTATHNMTEHLLAPIVVKCGPATAGSGFIIYAYSEIRMTGVFTVQWFWN